MQAEQRMVRVRSLRDSSTIVSVLSPVETTIPKVGQRIMISGITREALTQDTFDSRRVIAFSTKCKVLRREFGLARRIRSFVDRLPTLGPRRVDAHNAEHRFRRI